MKGSPKRCDSSDKCERKKVNTHARENKVDKAVGLKNLFSLKGSSPSQNVPNLKVKELFLNTPLRVTLCNHNSCMAPEDTVECRA